MDSKLLGRWKLARSENVDEYMKLSNVNLVFRKLAKTLSYDLEFLQDGDNYNLNAYSTFKNQKTPFKLNEHFEDVDFSGKKFKVKFYLEDGILKTTREPLEPEDPAYLNEFFINEDNELVQKSTITSVSPPVSSIRILRRVSA